MMYDVIIVGAGVCGLTAAVELSGRGKKILLLEAAPDIGGRCKSIILPNGDIFDTGAHWFHGGDENAFFQWAKSRYDLGPLSEDKAETGRIVLRDGRDVTEAFDAKLERFEQIYNNHKHDNGPEPSLRDIAKCGGDPDMEILAEYWARLWMSGDDAESVPAADLFDDPMGVGGWQIGDGVGSLMKQMAHAVTVNGGEIRTSSIVTHVVNGADDVTVTVDGGAQLSAKTCLVTVPVSVLQNQSILFDQMTQDMVGAKTSGLIMGNFFKAAVPMQPAFFEARDIPVNLPVMMIREGAEPVFIHARSGGKPVLTIFAGGQHARMLERAPANHIKDFAYGALRDAKIFEGFEHSVAGEIVTTDWSHDPFIGGSYTLRRPGFKASDPFKSGHVVFAGEGILAHHDDSPGQMTGAWKSAQIALELL